MNQLHLISSADRLGGRVSSTPSRSGRIHRGAAFSLRCKPLKSYSGSPLPLLSIISNKLTP
ncbi:hypothetical protein QC763_0054550 [Podospora pseudopauciseta]|uniref:Uncharacterized protein n=2 Tax=Podospora TaxID=5144 RepID=A0ABR0HGG2_9PEZI|nr:hypothetical protein QC763_0054550 [Podospora pseudopauciseta]KAK4678344.1 hypothetical protein QC764_0054290 [Podospora pseudoanserina]